MKENTSKLNAGCPADRRLARLFPTVFLPDTDVLWSGRTTSRSQTVDDYLSAENGEVNSYDLSH